VRVLVAMSGGVDSSVAAALLRDAGHEVVGATMKLWGGASDSGCCSVADVEDARRVAQQLGLAHHVFNFTEDFEADVVEPYVRAHAEGRTPNPCVECNRHLKFDRFLVRARQLGFDAIATGHHARVVRRGADDRLALCRGADAAKDQSYVLSMLGREVLRSVLLPVGELTKAEVRERAAAAGLRTADKAESQDVCFILGTGGGRTTFLGDRIPLRAGRVVDTSGLEVGSVPAVELVTVGQRRGLGGGGGGVRYALSVDASTATVVVGTEDELLTDHLDLLDVTWSNTPVGPGTPVTVQTSAHGTPVPATFDGDGHFRLHERHRRVAPGQTVAVYDGDEVLGAGIAAA
jgi:tRNA-specific 2-thiouridylase